MKKTTLGFLTAILLVSTNVFAQETIQTGVSYTSIGPVAGFGHSWVSDMATDFKPSAQLGLGVLYSKHKNWGFGSILVASHEGYSKEVSYAGNMYRNTINPVYLRMTPRVYYFFGDYGSGVRPKVYVGPSVAYKLDEQQYIEQPGFTNEYTYMQPDGEVFDNWDAGVNAGVGVNVRLDTYIWLNLDADYYHGFLDVMNFNNRNRSLRANVGLMIGI